MRKPVITWLVGVLLAIVGFGPAMAAELVEGATMHQPLTQREVFTRLRILVDGPQHSGAPEYAERTFGPVILGLPVSDEKKGQLIRLLQTRWNTVNETRQAIFSKIAADQRSDPLSARPHTPKSKKPLKEASRKIDRDITALVGSDVAGFVSEMIEVQNHLSHIANGYAEGLEEFGAPLSPHQRFKLALALRGLSESQNRWNRENRDDSFPARHRPEPLDSLGLTGSQEGALKRMEADGLSAEQINCMRLGFIMTSRGINKIPIEWERTCDLPVDLERIIAKAQGEDGPRFGKIYSTLEGAGPAKLDRRYSSDEREFCAVMFDSTPSDKNGAIYLMVSSGIALFYEGKLVDIVGESSVKWVGRRPRPKL